MASNYLPQRAFRKGDLIYVLTTGRWEISAVDRDRYSPDFCYGPAFLTRFEGHLLGSRGIYLEFARPLKLETLKLTMLLSFTEKYSI